MKVQLVTLFRVRHLQCYGVTVHGNVTSVALSRNYYSRENLKIRSIFR
jgi:hypothetical protein